MTIQLLLQSIVNGVGLSMVYILVALGLTLIFSILRVINFAHGEFYMMGGFIAYYGAHLFGLNYFVTLLAAFVLVGAAGVMIERAIFAPMRANILGGFIVSLGLLWILQAMATTLFGVLDKDVESPFHGIVRVLGIVISQERLFVIVCCALLFVCLYAFLRFSLYGMALRAAAQDMEAAALQGVNVDRIASLSFGIGCALAGIAGALLAPVYFVSPYMGTLPVVKAFIIIILGGMGSVPGAVVGGFFLGLLESVAPLYMPLAAVEILSFVVVMAVLLVRPQGLLGRA